MRHSLMIVTILLLSSNVFAQHPNQFGSADEAKAMLTRVIAAVKADKRNALEMFNNGEGGFRDRDLFPFCFQLSDGKSVATQTKQVLGKDVRTLKDQTGRNIGQELYDAAKEGQINEVSYSFAKPGPDTTPVPKVSFVTAVGDLGCGVGYYK